MHITLIGSGYVGLVTGACFADFGHDVVCVDTDASKIEALRAGRMPIYEPGLEGLVADNVRRKRLSFRTDLEEAVAGADAIFIAVGTPARKSDGVADLSYVHVAAREIAPHLTGFTVVVTKSTVPVGTGDEVERILRETAPDADFAVASNPEFLREGAAIADFKRPDRIVIGTEDERAGEVLREVYRPLYINQAPFLMTGRRTAELIKYAANAYLATKITFINEMADLCEKVGANVQEVARGIGLDNRIGSKFLHAGPGFGGSCFPKDTLALIKTAQDAEAPMRIVETVAQVNEQRKRAMARRIIAACGDMYAAGTIALLGLTFKPNTDDMREAPSLAIVAGLQDAGASVRAYDPEGMEQARLFLNDVEYADDAYSCAEGADALVVVTEWDAFRGLDLDRLRRSLVSPILVDLRNVYPAVQAKKNGFAYTGIGVQTPVVAYAAVQSSPGKQATTVTESSADAVTTWQRDVRFPVTSLRHFMRNGASKKILVTGGAGFLGSHLCDRLIAAGHEVLCVDNFFTGTRRNIEGLLGHPRFELMRHDVTFPLYVEVDEIYNLACPASPVHYQFDPVQTTKTSVHGAINVLGLAKRIKAKVLQASTSEVYGDPEVHPQSETYWGRVNPVGFRSCYDEGKRCAETLFFDYHRQHAVEIKVVRIFNTYGPRMHPDDGRVVSNVIVQALRGRDITLYGDGSQTRSFCYAHDLVEAMIRTMATGKDFTGPVNIGNPGEFTIRALAEMVLELTGSRSQMVHRPLPPDDPRQRRPDITLAREALGWEPTVALREGLEKTIGYFEALLSESDHSVSQYRSRV